MEKYLIPQSKKGHRPLFICRHNSKEYSPLEKKFIDIINSDSELREIANRLKLLHEWRIQIKTSKFGKTKIKTYWLDFFSAKKGVDIEIHHNGHKKGRWFIPSQNLDVYTKDKERKKLLSKIGIKTVEIYQTRLTKGWIRQYLKEIDSLPDAINLDYFMQ